MTADYLAGILRRKREEIAILKSRARGLRAAAANAPPARPWADALRRSERVALIAELKRRAPSAGSLCPELDPPALARTYEEAGAAALSVLTDGDFDGKLQDLERARSAVSLPALRKDFILDPVQIHESRAAGADAVLLIVRSLPGDELEDLLAAAAEAGMGALVEVHDDEELGRALAANAQVVGINNRDLATLSTDLEVAHRLASLVPPDRILVAESGIVSAEQVRELGALGVDAVLVGRALVSDPDPGRLAGELAAQPKRERS
ncbi:MAG: indole-3-glycerol phosphate synthase TrpC [Gemmatimonadota bacterium]